MLKVASFKCPLSEMTARHRYTEVYHKDITHETFCVTLLFCVQQFLSDCIIRLQMRNPVCMTCLCTMGTADVCDPISSVSAHMIWAQWLTGLTQ